MYLLGIDLGTSAVKAILTAPNGRVAGIGGIEYGISRPQPDRAEQSPDDWWTATAGAVRLAMDQVGGPSQAVLAIGLSGQMHGTVLLDRTHHLLHQAIIWPDRRSTEQVKEIGRRVGKERLIQISGSPAATGFQAATLLWLQQEMPKLWRKTQLILTPKDYLRWRLTGEISSEPSDGSGTLLLDVQKRDWSAELMDMLSIKREQLPPIFPSSTVSGLLSRPAAEALGLRPGIPVVAGAADTACSLLGAGVTGNKTLLITISSGGQIILPSNEVKLDLQGRLHTFCSAIEPQAGRAAWYQMAAILSAGMSLRWLRDQLFCLPSEGAYERMISWAEEAHPGANGLLFLPYLAGERTPHMDPYARGMFLGLTAGHGRDQMVRAVMEGVGLACFDAYSVLAELGARPEQIIMAGGGARSELWRQIVADIFDLPVQPLLVNEQSAVGACLLAGGGIGAFYPFEVAQSWAVYGPVVEPQPNHTTRYRQLLAIFRSAYRKHIDDFQELSKYEQTAVNSS